MSSTQFSPQPLFEAFYNHYRLEDFSEKTIQGMRFALTFFSKWVPDVLTASETQALNFFQMGKEGKLTGTPWSAWHRNNIRKYLMKFYTWAIARGHCDNNPIANVPLARLPRLEPKRLSEEAKMKVLYHAQNYKHPSELLRARNHAIVATYLVTGLRATELLELERPAVSLKEYKISVDHGKGNKQRTVYFNRFLARILETYLKELERVGKESIYFFVSYGSNKPLRYGNLRRMFKQISNASGVNFTAHQFRHTCFSTMAEQGVPLPTIQAQAGHSSITTTQIYMHTSSRHRRMAMDRVSFA